MQNDGDYKIRKEKAQENRTKEGLRTKVRMPGKTKIALLASPI